MNAPLRILIVDDDPALRKLLTQQLEALGYKVDGYAESRKVAEELATRTKPDLIFMDVVMETRTAGIEAARRIRKQIDVPIIFITTDDESSTLRRALKTAPFGYLVKPIKPETLRAAIEVTRMRHGYEQDLKEAHRALEDSESLFRGIYSNMQHGYYRLDAKNRFLLANPAFMEMVGLSPTRKINGRSMEELGIAADEERDTLRRILKQAGRVVQHEGHWQHLDGHKLVVIENCWEVRDDDGEMLYYEGTVQDISHVRALENQLKHSQKLDLIGVLAGRIAHELNNRLTGVLGYADLLKMQLKDDSDLMRYVEAIRTNTRNSSGVIQQLLKFSHKPEAEPHVQFHLDALLEGRQDLLSVILSSKIELRQELDASRTFVKGDPKQIEQILLNLVLNAREAMPEGGVLTLRLSDADFVSPYQLNGVIPHGKYVRLTVSDTGSGIEPQNIDRIFEPFFTTKDEGIGSGLGLSIVKSMVEDNHGFIRVDSQPGNGTQFEILLPVLDPDSD